MSGRQDLNGPSSSGNAPHCEKLGSTPSGGQAVARHNRALLSSFLTRLDGFELEQFQSYDSTCGVCGEPHYGILDESLLTLPIQGIANFFRRRKGFDPDKTVRYGPGLAFSFGYNAYEVRMNIVRSGMFTREQLSGMLFNQHELEVNDYSFKKIRPPRCGCMFGGDSDQETLALLQSEGVPIMTQVEADRLIGNDPVRTGFRRRSPEARKRRSSRSASRVGTTVTVPSKGPTGAPCEVTLTFQDTTVLVSNSARKRRNRAKGARLRRLEVYNARREQIPVISRPKADHRKYWYFLRKTGSYYLSLDNPLEGDDNSGLRFQKTLRRKARKPTRGGYG